MGTHRLLVRAREPPEVWFVSEVQARYEERRAAEGEEHRELVARRAKEERGRLMERVMEQARQTVADEAAARGTTLKGIPEPQRGARIREVADQLLRRYEGKKRTRRDTK